MSVVDYFKPANLEAALDLLSEYGQDARILAGGTDLLVALRKKTLSCKYLVDVKGIPELKELSYDADRGLAVGGAVTVNRLMEAKPVRDCYPILVQAGRALANTLVRNRATLVGNLCNASPGADLAPACLVLDARAVVASKKGIREIGLEEFFIGVKRTSLGPEELVVRVEFPPHTGKGLYLKKARIKGHDLSQVGVAGYLRSDGELRLALGAVGPKPILVKDFGRVGPEDLRREETVKTILDKVLSHVNPISDQRASREYRLAMATYFVRRILAGLGEGC